MSSTPRSEGHQSSGRVLRAVRAAGIVLLLLYCLHLQILTRSLHSQLSVAQERVSPVDSEAFRTLNDPPSSTRKLLLQHVPSITTSSHKYDSDKSRSVATAPRRTSTTFTFPRQLDLPLRYAPITQQILEMPPGSSPSPESVMDALQPRNLGGRSGFGKEYHAVYMELMTVAKRYDKPDSMTKGDGPHRMSISWDNLFYERGTAHCYGPWENDGLCRGSPTKEAYQRTNGRWSIGDGSHLTWDKHHILGGGSGLGYCKRTREIDVGALFLSAVYFDHVSGNHYHWMADGLMHLFGGLVDAGLIDPQTSEVTRNYTLAIFGPHRNYVDSPPPESFSTLVDMLAPNVLYLNNLKSGECVHFKKVFYVSEAVGLDHRFLLDWPRFQFEKRDSSTVRLADRYPKSYRAFAIAPAMRSFFLKAIGITSEAPVDYLGSGDILVINRRSNRHSKDHIHKDRQHGGLRQILGTDEFLHANERIKQSFLRGRVKEVDFSEYSIVEQIKLVHGAAAMIGIHGAGLGNTFWLQPHALLVELTPYKLCGCDYYMNSVFLSAAMTVGASYTNLCLTREQVKYVESNDPEDLGRITPTQEQLDTRSGIELCKDEGGRYPWLFGIDGVTLTSNEWASLLIGKLKTEFVGRLASEAAIMRQYVQDRKVGAIV